MKQESIDELLIMLNDHTIAFQKQEMKMQLIDFINHLLLNDFNRLVQILYRIDVDEQKLKSLLQQNPQTDAAVLIADLLIQRQEEKLKSKQEFKEDTNISENEKW